MTDDGQTIEQESFLGKHSFSIFIVISLIITAILVFISMALYSSSGAAQLDLSRPGYVSVSSQVTTDGDDYQVFSSNGSLDTTTVNNFIDLYKEQAEKAKAIDAFSTDPLNTTTLEIDDNSATSL